MALNLDKSLKAYYSIKEVAEMFSLSESTLRYWETEFPLLKPRTTGNKIRQYTDKDIEQLRVIYNLVKVRGFRIAAARKMMSANRDGVEKQAKILDKLMFVRDELMELKKQMDRLQ